MQLQNDIGGDISYCSQPVINMVSSSSINLDPSLTAASEAPNPQLDKKYNLKPFVPVGKPKEDIHYVDLDAIDLGKYKEGSSPEAVASRQALAKQLDKSLRTYGFFFLVNHGIDPATFERIDSINQALHSIDESQKLAHRSGGLTSDEDVNSVGAERGPGFKPRRYWGMANGVRDNIEFFNFVNIVQDSELQNEARPELARVYTNEVANYFRYIHHNVLRRLTTLCDIVLELPEGTIYDRYFKVVQGDINASGGGFGRLMVYYGQDDESNKLTEDTWLRGHSDSDGFTFIASQPMVSLQIRDYKTKKWGYVNHVPNALVVNIGDAVEFITGGYFRSTIHRVVNPPESQQNGIRQSTIYFCKPSWNSYIDPEDLKSPRLERLGVHSPPDWERITYEQWDVEKGRLFGKSKINDKPGEEPEPVYIHGRLAERWHPTLDLSKLNLTA